MYGTKTGEWGICAPGRARGLMGVLKKDSREKEHSVGGGLQHDQHWACAKTGEEGGDQAWAGETSQRGGTQADGLRTPHLPEAQQRPGSTQPSTGHSHTLSCSSARLGRAPGTSACPAPRPAHLLKAPSRARLSAHTATASSCQRSPQGDAPAACPQPSWPGVHWAELGPGMTLVSSSAWELLRRTTDWKTDRASSCQEK